MSELCDYCSTRINTGGICLQCGAPECCPQCCNETTEELESTLRAIQDGEA